MFTLKRTCPGTQYSEYSEAYKIIISQNELCGTQRRGKMEIQNWRLLYTNSHSGRLTVNMVDPEKYYKNKFIYLQVFQADLDLDLPFYPIH